MFFVLFILTGNFSKNNFGSLLAVPIGDFVLQSDGYIINETDSVLGRLYGSNTDSIGFYVYGKNRFFVKKGMRVNASASGLYFIPFNDWYIALLEPLAGVHKCKINAL